MKKPTQLLVLFLVLPFIGFSQNEWAPVGAEWNFGLLNSYDYDGFVGWENIKVTGDTVVLGQDCRTLVRTETSYQGQVKTEIFFSYEANSIIYYYRPDVFDQFEILYDFSASVGDSVTYFGSLYSPGASSFAVISGVKDTLIDGVALKEIELNTYEADGGILWRYTEKIGSITDGMFANPVAVIDGYTFRKFRCYQDDQITVKLEEDCEFFGELTGTNDVFKSSLKIFPNPARDQINIQLSDFEGRMTYQVLDQLGRQLSSDVLLNNNDQIDIDSLNPGVYYLLISGKEGSTARRFVKL